VEAQVLQHQHFAGLQRRGLGLGIRPTIRGEEHGLAQQTAQVFGDGLQAHGRVHLALRAAEVAHQDRAAAIAQDLVHRGHDGPRAVVVGHFAVGVLRHVEVHAHQRFLAP
jgi:hypothetical protein